MSTLETTPFVDRPPIGGIRQNGLSDKKAWKVSAIAGDILTLGVGMALAAVLTTLLVFLIPRLISVEQFGYWRVFLLYAGYVGFLHFGFADGALLRWAGRPLNQFQHELWPAVKFLFLQHVIVVVPACVIVWFVVPVSMRFVVLAIAIYAPIYNIAATLQFALQSARIFRPVAVSMVLAPATVLALVLLWHVGLNSDFREIVGFYLAGWFGVLMFLLLRTGARHQEMPQTSLRRLSAECLLSGWPIVMANTGATLVVYADRLALSWAATIQNFAQYSLAASAMMVPVTAIQAGSKVFFSHLASITPQQRSRVHRISSQLLIAVWAILLPYYFLLNSFIHRFLPRYVQSLQSARILLLGIPFLAAIQILQTNCAYLNGRQKQFLKWTVLVLAIALSLSIVVAFKYESLTAMAIVQVACLGGWWLSNEIMLRRLTGQTKQHWTKFGLAYVFIGASYWFTTSDMRSPVAYASIFYLLITVVLAATCREELKFIAGKIRHSYYSA